MQTKLNPYLSFKDNAREAMDFYQTVFGGKLAMSTFKEYHASQDPSEDNKVMHAVLEADKSLPLWLPTRRTVWSIKPGRTIACH